MADTPSADAGRRLALAAKAAGDEAYSLPELLEIMAILRTPEIGCPWDLEQNFATIAPYTIEEAYEVADAIARGDLSDLKDELGDLLLQVVFHAQMAGEAQLFDFAGVADAISRKLIRRHPHVFGDETARSAAQVPGLWTRIKAEEVVAKAAASGRPPRPKSILDDIPLTLPALTRSLKLQKRAAHIAGFDWNRVEGILEKLREELAELEAEIGTDRQDAIQEEFGDLLFVMANLARRLEVDPEEALRRANMKFTKRFNHIERRIEERGVSFDEVTLEQMEEIWQEAKRLEKEAMRRAAAIAEGEES